MRHERDQSPLQIDGVQPRVLAAEAGLGVFGTFYPDYAGEGATGTLVQLPFDGPSPRVEVGLVAQRPGTGSASVREFADWLRQLADDDPAPAAPDRASAD